MCVRTGVERSCASWRVDDETKLSCRRRLDAFGDGRQHGSKDDGDRASL